MVGPGGHAREPRLQPPVEQSSRLSLLAPILAGSGFLTTGLVLLALAPRAHGGVHVLTLLLGIGTLALGLWCVGFWLAVGAFWGFATGFLQRKPSTAQWFMWLIMPVGCGAVGGTATYAYGPSSLVGLPTFFAVAALTVRSLPGLEPYQRRRWVVWFGVLCAVALAVGLTVFL